MFVRPHHLTGDAHPLRKRPPSNTRELACDLQLPNGIQPLLDLACAISALNALHGLYIIQRDVFTFDAVEDAPQAPILPADLKTEFGLRVSLLQSGGKNQPHSILQCRIMERRLISIKRKLDVLIQGRRGDVISEDFRAVELIQDKDALINSNIEIPIARFSRTVTSSRSHTTREFNNASGDSVEPRSVSDQDVSLPCVPLFTPGGLRRLTPTQGSATRSAKAISVPLNSNRSRNMETINSTGASAESHGHELSTTLVNRLSQAMQKSAFKETRCFIPVGELETLICRSAIRKELSSTNSKSMWGRALHMKKRYILASQISPWHISRFAPRLKISKLPKQKRSEFKRIFAILVLMNRAFEITNFINHAVTDQKLPLIRTLKGEECFFVSQSEPGTVLRCFENWNQGDIDSFEDFQWRVLAPVFNQSDDEEAHHMTFDDAHVLPFCKWTCYARGGSACIYMAEIHAQHNKLKGTSDHSNVFAVKHLLKPRRVYPLNGNSHNEIDILRGMLKREHQHPHLINILATFCFDGMDYIILPWAEFDLLKYWRCKNPDPLPSRKTVTWMMDQCHGLASALYNIHRWPTFNNSRLYTWGTSRNATFDDNERLVLLGRHGDIKPMNILWLDNGFSGILKLADFGAAHFDAEGFPAPINLDAQGTPGYRAPEYDLATSTNSSWDVWALGCVYLEFVTWLSQGWAGVDSFANSRLAPDPKYSPIATTTFFEPREGGDNQTLKQAVRQHVENLSKEAPYTAVQQFLSYIMEKMVMVPSGTAQRSNAKDVMQRTDEFLNELKKATIRETQLPNFADNIYFI